MVANLADIEKSKINSVVQKPVLSLVKNESSNSDTNNISELLAGNIENKQNNISNISDKNLSKISKNNIIKECLSLLLICGISSLFGFLTAKTKAFSFILNMLSKTKCAKSLQKILRSKFIKNELKLRRMKLANFKPVEFQKSINMKEIKKFAKKFAIKIKGKADDIEQLNDSLYVITDLYNQSKGRIIFPKTLKIVKEIKNASADVDRLTRMRLTKMSDRKTLLHEIGHVNHFKKLGFARDTILDAKKFKDFGIDKDTLNYISEILGDYAITEPHEFVAECYKELLSGKKLPDRIMQIYRMFKGPTNWKYIKKPIKNYNVQLSKIAETISKETFQKANWIDISLFENIK